MAEQPQGFARRMMAQKLMTDARADPFSDSRFMSGKMRPSMADIEQPTAASDYAGLFNGLGDALMGDTDVESSILLPLGRTPEGEIVPAFPQVVQGIAQGVRGMGQTVGRAMQGDPRYVPIDGKLPDSVIDEVNNIGLSVLGFGVTGANLIKNAVPDGALAMSAAKIKTLARNLGRDAAKDAKDDPGYLNLAKVRVPLDEMSASYKPTENLAKTATTDPQQMVGGTMVALPGDRTAAGKMLTAVNEQQLENPVLLQGGRDFARTKAAQDAKAGWASEKAVLSSVRKGVLDAEGNPVYGVYSAMGGRSADFSHHVADTIIELLPSSKIAKKNIKKFDAEMRKTDKDWPGIGSERLKTYLYQPGKGNVRKLMADTMEKGAYRDAGFPDLPSIRSSVAADDLRYGVNDPTGGANPTGSTILRLNPEGVVTEGSPKIHKTYPSIIKADEVGGFDVPVPRRLVFPSFYANRRAQGIPELGDRRSFEISSVKEPVTQELADNLSLFRENFIKGLFD
jgi:hypothetical protein